MFRSKTIKSSQIPTDVADLINDIDAVASPFDERSEKQDDDLVLISQEEEATAIPTKTEETPDSIPHDDDDDVVDDDDDERQPSPDLSMQVSELSLEDDLAFLEQFIQTMSPKTVDESFEQDNVAPQEEEEEEDTTNLLLPNVEEPRGDSTKLNENDVSTDSDEFNPFVNIGNLLLDTQDIPQEAASVVKRALTKVSTTVMQLLHALMKMLLFFFFTRRHTRLTGLMLFVCALGMYLYGWTTQQLQQDSPLVITENGVDSLLLEETIQGSSIIPLGGYLTFNSTITEETVPEVFDFDSILELDSANQHFIAVLKVLALCLAACSILGIRSTCKTTTREDSRAHYEALNVKDLKTLLRHRNLCTSGLHSHLVDRLLHHDHGDDASVAESICHVDLVAVQKNMTVKALKKGLASRGLPRTGIKDDLILKLWIPARINELKGCKRDELREILKRKNLSPSGMKQELIVRLVEAGH